MDPALFTLMFVVVIIASGLAATSVWLNYSYRRAERTPIGVRYGSRLFHAAPHVSHAEMLAAHPERIGDRWARIEAEFLRDPAESARRADSLARELLVLSEREESRRRGVDPEQVQRQYQHAKRVLNAAVASSPPSVDGLRQAVLAFREVGDAVIPTRRVDRG